MKVGYLRVGVGLDTARSTPRHTGQPPDAPHTPQELHQLLLTHVAEDILQIRVSCTTTKTCAC